MNNQKRVYKTYCTRCYVTQKNMSNTLDISKVMRYACLVYAVPHATTDDVRIAGYSIPSGTTVYANMWRWKNLIYLID